MSTIYAIYEGGVFRPLGPVALPDHCKVTLDPQRVDAEQAPPAHLEAIYEILGHSYDTGRTDLAALIDDHQP